MFEEVDRAAESERLVGRMRTRKIAACVIGGIVAVALVATAVAFKMRLDAIGHFRDESRSVDADVKALHRGARTDAETLTSAFDDREFATLLREQGPIWTDRLQRCDALARRLQSLVPRDAGQTRLVQEIEQRLEDVRVASAQLSRLADGSDLIVARSAAQRMAGTG